MTPEVVPGPTESEAAAPEVVFDVRDLDVYYGTFRAVRDVLILDEVFAVGDLAFREACYRRFLQLHDSGHSMILVSHDDEEIAKFCDRALLLEGGRIVASGTGAEVAEAYRELLGQAAAE